MCFLCMEANKITYCKFNQPQLWILLILMTKQISVLTSLLLLYTQCLRRKKWVTTLVENWKEKFQGQNKYIRWCLERIPCDDRVKFYIYPWVAVSNSSLVVFAQVIMFTIAQASKFKSYFWKPKFFGHSLYAVVVRIKKHRVFLLKNS